MASFIIEGGHRLSGDITPQGAKNEVLQIICATLLTGDEIIVRNVPDILDVNNLIQLIRDMGVRVSKLGVDAYSFQAAQVDLESHHLPSRRRQDRTPTVGHALHRHPKAGSFLPL